MLLTQAEVVQVLRRRANLNQGDLGARAFNTSFESGRTKIKNIELGKQIPTTEDLQNMARVLNVDTMDLLPTGSAPSKAVTAEPGAGIWVTSQVLALFPGLESYMDMLNKAAALDDTELIAYLGDKIAAIFKGHLADVAASG